MNSIEEKLWNYIDGNCTPAEQQAIAMLIEQDEAYRQTYNELLSLNADFAAIELDEPPMAFTYNVMEQIRAEQTQKTFKPLKASVDKRIIRGIAWFFILSIGILVIFALSQAEWKTNTMGLKLPQLKLPTVGLSSLGLPSLGKWVSAPLVQGFLFFDLILVLYLFDYWLRHKKTAKTV
jgi:hypothetical protein